jgi:hypothetical protein
MRAGLAGGGARKETLIPVGASAGWYARRVGRRRRAKRDAYTGRRERRLV